VYNRAEWGASLEGVSGLLDPVGALKELGWSEAEARLYVALAETGETLTGYQCAKMAGIPRPNAYPALQRLVRRGAIVEIPLDAGVRFQAVPFDQVRRALADGMDRLLSQVETGLSATALRGAVSLGRGRAAFLSEALALIEGADEALSVGASAGSVDALGPALTRQAAQGTAVTFYCFDRCPTPGCGVCREPIPLSEGPFVPHGWLVLVAQPGGVLVVQDLDREPVVLRASFEPLTEALTVLLSRLPRPDPDAVRR
jgi:predicted transcriptional regulator